MDSGSVNAVAHDLLTAHGKGPLKVYSLARRRGIACAESQRIYATLDHLGLQGTQIIADEEDSLIEALDADLAEPFDGQFLFLKAIYAIARRDGVKVVLDGAAGDLVFNAGNYIGRLLRRGRFSEAWREVVGEQGFWELPAPHREFLRYLGSAFAPNPVKALLRKPRQRREEHEYIDSSLILPEFTRRIDIEARFERMRETFSGLQSDNAGLERVRKMRPNLTAGRERYARIAASAGVEGRDPFTDQRVVDFCSRLPDHQLARDGWPKFLLRIAMRGMLPDTVRWSPGKPHIGGLYNKTFLGNLIRNGRASRESLEHSLENYVDPAALRTAWSAFASGGSALPVHSAYILSCWLEQSVTRPVVNYQAFG
jgi:asparagine synthase (glutamine-hydrolysing)